MAKWSSAQELFIAQNAERGAVWIAQEMQREFGVKRTPHAIKCKACERGISLTHFDVCPRCGAKVRQVIKTTGFCALCTARENRDKARLTASVVQANEDLIARELPQTKREWARARQQKYRSQK